MENQEKKPFNSSDNSRQGLKNSFGLQLLEIGTEFALIIFIPLWVFLKLNNRFNSSHSKLYTISGLLLALLLSFSAIGVRIKDLKKRLK